MDILARPIAITDVETTGPDPTVHEIVEIGLVLVDPRTLAVVDTLDVKVLPEHPERATAFAVKLNGYNAEDWKDALTLEAALQLYSPKTKDALFCAHNVTFDWSFITGGFKKTNVENLMDYHRVDLFTMAWTKLHNSGLEKFNMNEVAKYLGIPEEPTPHRAIHGALNAYEIYKRLLV